MVEILVDIGRFLHFAGLAALLGPLLVQARVSERRVTPLMIAGALTQLVTGIALLLLTLADANHMKAGVKLLVLVVILVVVLIGRKRGLGAPAFMSVLILTVANLGLAVFW
jgi:hypothetical protein